MRKRTRRRSSRHRRRTSRRTRHRRIRHRRTRCGGVRKKKPKMVKKTVKTYLGKKTIMVPYKPSKRTGAKKKKPMKKHY